MADNYKASVDAGLAFEGRIGWESESGWVFPVGDEVHELGYTNMFTDMFDAMDSGKSPMETIDDGYVVNAVMDACYQSIKTRQWETVKLDVWRGAESASHKTAAIQYDERFWLIKEEKMPDGQTKLILKDKASGEIIQRFV